MSIYTLSNSLPFDLCMVDITMPVSGMLLKSSTDDSNINSKKSLRYFVLLVCSNVSIQRLTCVRAVLRLYFANVACFALSHSVSVMSGVVQFCFSCLKKYRISTMLYILKPSSDCISLHFMPCFRNRASVVDASRFVFVRMQVLPLCLLAISSLTSGR